MCLIRNSELIGNFGIQTKIVNGAALDYKSNRQIGTDQIFRS